MTEDIIGRIEKMTTEKPATSEEIRIFGISTPHRWQLLALRANVQTEIDKAVKLQGSALLHTHFKGLIECREQQAVEKAMGELKKKLEEIKGCRSLDRAKAEGIFIAISELDARWPKAKEKRD